MPEFNESLFNEALFGEGAGATTPADLLRREYTLDLLDETTHLCFRRLPFWGVGTVWIGAVNEPDRLELHYPLDDDAAQYITYPKVVALYDKAGNVLQKFHVGVRRRVRTEDGSRRLVVECESLEAQLGWDENVDLYETSGATSITQIVADLLNGYQPNDQWLPIVLGGIDPSIGNETRECRFERCSVRKALRDLQSTVGGYIYVDPNRRLWWKQSIGSKTYKELRLGKNLPAMEVVEDFRTIRTRMIGLGRGLTSDSRLECTVDASTQETYGIRTGWYSNLDIFHQDFLDNKTAEMAEKYKVPQEEVTVEAIDLSKANVAWNYSHEGLSLGQQLRVIDEVLEKTVETQVVMIRRDLTHPARVIIQLGGPQQPDAVDVLADVIEALKDDEQNDSGLVESLLAEIDLDGLDDLVTLNKLQRCPDARLNGAIDDEATTFQIKAGGLLPEDADTPFVVRFYLADDYDTYETCECTDVTAGVYTITRDPETAAAWADNTPIQRVLALDEKAEKPVQCDVVTLQHLEGALAKLGSSLTPGGGLVGEFGDDIQPIGDYEEPGTNEAAARDNHEHGAEKLFWRVPSAAHLPPQETTLYSDMDDSTIYAVLNEDAILESYNLPGIFLQIDSEIVEPVSLETAGAGTTWSVVRGKGGTTPAAHESGATVTLVPALLEGARALTEDDGMTWIYRDGEWAREVRAHRAADKANLPTDGVADGDVGVTTSNPKRGYMYVNSTWICITNLEGL